MRARRLGRCHSVVSPVAVARALTSSCIFASDPDAKNRAQTCVRAAVAEPMRIAQ
jgi:hypothetical protein